MGRLNTLKPRVQLLPLVLGPASTRFGDEHRGSRHERGYGTAWDRQRKVILARDCGLCQPCQQAGRVATGRTVDHIVPKAEGGTDDENNLQTICDACHKAKTQAESRRARGA